MKTEYVLGFLYKDNLVSLIKKKRPDWQAGKFNGIGGHIDDGESPLDAMVREFNEEAGVTVLKEKLDLFLVFEGGAFKVYCYATSGDYEIRTVTDEHIGWFQVDKINELNIVENNKWIIPMGKFNQDKEQVQGIVFYP